ncbi:MAG: heme-binding protein [Synergistaceae bacterium]|nr:heme-binding protein [Synergistaceae bacterium]
MTVRAPDGSLLAFERMKDSLPVSINVSQNKALTALNLKMDTRDLGPLVQPGAALYGLLNDPSVVAFGGGRLLKINDKIVGAVGVSGGSPDEDMQVADAAVRCFEALRK